MMTKDAIRNPTFFLLSSISNIMPPAIAASHPPRAHVKIRQRMAITERRDKPKAASPLPEAARNTRRKGSVSMINSAKMCIRDRCITAISLSAFASYLPIIKNKRKERIRE